ncbi:hypothetical protein M153_4268000685 [Pseudoloma neurophilia]|uniref:Uncharacterized protein n=1 Tax=Pseudoloma neurophilia TaxID=146866 RepID=A0A0R0LZD5_9MICR|nr:hypothetical protein M153_4268000685 [Pseudoloma neurophilia]
MSVTNSDIEKGCYISRIYYLRGPPHLRFYSCDGVEMTSLHKEEGSTPDRIS